MGMVNSIRLLILVFIPTAFAIQLAVAQSSNSPDYTLSFIEINGTIRIFKQNETARIEIPYPEGMFENVGMDFPYRKHYEEEKIIFNRTPLMTAWNGEYFLMDNGHSLIKYDGQKFEVIRYAEGFYSAYHIEKMIPVGKYWLLVYVDKGTPYRIIRIFSGEDFKDFFNIPASFYSPLWAFYILPLLVVLFILSLLRDLRKKKRLR